MLKLITLSLTVGNRRFFPGRFGDLLGSGKGDEEILNIAYRVLVEKEAQKLVLDVVSIIVVLF